ncbi:hypothetical protein M433DRAFT_22310 [Acidomyces richmondensis BFW]|nr:hypothetical protein M433DRAFT_22310 [Acidomyces richmondensis BFW]
MSNIQERNSLQILGNIIDNCKYSDLVLICDAKQFNVHKNIMCSASKIIAAACDNDMKEARTGRITHEEFDADTVERMIEYIYKQNYEIPNDCNIIATFKFPSDHDGIEDDGKSSFAWRPAIPPAEKDDPESNETEMDDMIQERCRKETFEVSGVNAKLIAHSRVYAIGQYYDIPTLSDFAVEQFIAETGWQLEGFIEVIREINRLTSTNDRLRSVLREKALRHMEEMTADKSFMTNLIDTGDFAHSMLKDLVAQRAKEKLDNLAQLELKDTELGNATEHYKSLEQKLAYTEEIMKTLVNKLEKMPIKCRNFSCDRTFGALKLDRKNGANGKNTGHWIVRCKGCGCNLCKYCRD